MAENFNLYSQYYDLLYQDKSYAKEAAYVCQEIFESDPKAKMMLELGCGSGAHAQHLSERGFQIVGIDQSETMIEAAKQKQIANFETEVGDITSFELNKKFDCAISLFHVVSYLTSNEVLLSCFKTVNRHLNEGGVFLFDVWFTPAVYHLKPESRTKNFENESIKVERFSKSVMDITANTIDVHFDIHIEHKKSAEHAFLQENHLMRHFSVPEISFFAEVAGFKLLKCEELLTKNEPGLDTWAVCFVLQKLNEL